VLNSCLRVRTLKKHCPVNVINDVMDYGMNIILHRSHGGFVARD